MMQTNINGEVLFMLHITLAVIIFVLAILNFYSIISNNDESDKLEIQFYLTLILFGVSFIVATLAYNPIRYPKKAVFTNSFDYKAGYRDGYKEGEKNMKDLILGTDSLDIKVK